MGIELQARTIDNFKQALWQCHNIESQVKVLKLILKDKSECLDKKAASLAACSHGRKK